MIKLLPLREVGRRPTTADTSQAALAAIGTNPALGRDDQSRPASRGRRTIVAATTPPDSRGTSQKSLSLAGT